MPLAGIGGRRDAGVQYEATRTLALSPLRAPSFTIPAPINPSSSTSPEYPDTQINGGDRQPGHPS